MPVNSIESPNYVRHFLHVFPSFGIGGVPLRMVRIINHLASRGRHTIVALDGAFDAATRLRPEIDVELLPLVLEKSRPLANLLAYRRVLQQRRPDVLLTFNWGSIEWAAANRLRAPRRHLHLESGFGVEEASGQLKRRVIARRWALGRCERIIVPSRTLEHIALRVWGLPPEKVTYIANGIDVAAYASATANAARRDEAIVIGTLAPLRPEKNVGRLIRALATLDQRLSVRLEIVGDGGERGKLQALVAELGLADRVAFLGQSATPERFLQGIDIFALSSDTEQMPNALLEAMATALPVAAVDVGDVRTMVAEENRAFIVPRDDIAAFGAALAALAADGTLRRAIGMRNRDKAVAEYRQENMFAAYDRILLAAPS